MKQLFIIICLINLVSLASKAIQVYEHKGPSVTKEFKGNRSPAIVTNN